jgi:serine/threonine-protein kinase ATR
VDLRRRSRIERTDEDLVFELINEHLAPVLRAASETDIQDTAAVAIQELLKLNGCQAVLTGRRVGGGGGSRTPSSRSAKSATSNLNQIEGTTAPLTIESGEQLWKRFTDDVKEIITPCLTSKYRLRIPGSAMAPGPLFKSGMPFRRWMYQWIRRLISEASGRRAEIFTACGAVLRYDMGTALYLLPYLVLNVVCDGTENARADVTEEILTVLKTRDEDFNNGNSTRTLTGPSEVSTQTVFTLLDSLGQWLDDCKQGGIVTTNHPSSTTTTTTPSKGTRGSAKAEAQLETTRIARRLENVSKLLAAIPKQSLAGASYRCQAYARALLYFESHVREKSGALNPAAEKSGTFTDNDVTFLLDIYSGLEEPDGLSGISRLRKCSTLQDQILINEKAGNWGEALTCCEQALQMEPNSVTRHLGVLDCLLNMGHLQV